MPPASPENQEAIVQIILQCLVLYKIIFPQLNLSRRISGIRRVIQRAIRICYCAIFTQWLAAMLCLAKLLLNSLKQSSPLPDFTFCYAENVVQV